MSKNQEIIDHFLGRFVTGNFQKIDGTIRPFWGVLKREERDNPNLVTVYDMRVGYRRFRLDQGIIKLKSGNIFYKYNHKNGITFKSRSA
tara:strand:+ start:1068 stop:1334 length:267 start_codon:yes stop_codon:yes gene_type:complete